ncbi:hypothetical protein EK21DRAFT_93900 [Setomelanomma holmii]|uniref:Uncharacterized protein n=1 Tax=Setomelanomma holmii TaxID=210430 RepID=A0A9P4LGX5_9PLEO|nr:hypothetical protein EK21DRAFT_93900 [Setomelanomma holmii]
MADDTSAHAELKVAADALSRVIVDVKELRALQQKLAQHMRELQSKREKRQKLLACLLERHAKAQLRPLMDSMLTRLPQELRNNVYEHLLVSDQHIFAYRRRPLRVKPNDSAIYPDNRLLNPGYVGDVAAAGMNGIHYSRNTFELKVGKGCFGFGALGQVPSRYRPGKYRLECCPSPRWLARNVRIHVDTKVEPTSTLPSQFTVHTEDSCPGQDAMTRIEVQLMGILDLKGGTNAKVDFIVTRQVNEKPTIRKSYTREHERRFVNTMEGLRRTIYELKHSDVSVTVTLGNQQRLKVYDELSPNGRHVYSSWDFTSHLSLTVEESRAILQERSETRRVVEFRYILSSMIYDPPDGDPDEFYAILWQRWRLRCALPWLGNGWET